MDKAIAGYFAVGVLERFPQPQAPCPREALNGILWALRAGAQWKDLPGRCPAAPDLPPQIPAMDKGRVVQAHY